MILQRVSPPRRSNPFSGPGPSFQFQEGDRGFVPSRDACGRHYFSSGGSSIVGNSGTESKSKHPDAANWQQLSTPETSPRDCHSHSCVPQYELLAASSPKKDGPDETVAMACYMQMPVVFMMLPLPACNSQNSGQQRPNASTLKLSELILPPDAREHLTTEASPCSSTAGLEENMGQDEEPMFSQIVQEPPCRGPSLTASRRVPAGFTTLVIRNIPARYTTKMLLREFEPDGNFDFFFLPYSFRASKTMGVAFVNFLSHDLALSFQKKWHRCFLSEHGCANKHLDVAAAAMQGLAENLKQFNEKNIARLESVGMLPVFVDNHGHRLNSLQELRRHGVLP